MPPFVLKIRQLLLNELTTFRLITPKITYMSYKYNLIILVFTWENSFINAADILQMRKID